MNETYWEWKRRVVRDLQDFGGPFWELVDANWTPAEQSELARVWKQGRYVTEADGA